jgi:hypothetical protein
VFMGKFAFHRAMGILKGSMALFKWIFEISVDELLHQESRTQENLGCTGEIIRMLLNPNCASSYLQMHGPVLRRRHIHHELGDIVCLVEVL